MEFALFVYELQRFLRYVYFILTLYVIHPAYLTIAKYYAILKLELTA